MEAIQITTTVRADGLLCVPDLRIGEQVQVIVLRKTKGESRIREGGWAAGKVHLMPGFDDPIPGMEDYQ